MKILLKWFIIRLFTIKNILYQLVDYYLNIKIKLNLKFYKWKLNNKIYKNCYLKYWIIGIIWYRTFKFLTWKYFNKKTVN